MYGTRVSVLIPATSHLRLRYLLSSLSRQTQRPYEVIIVLKNADVNYVEGVCTERALRCTIIEQTHGYFTHALNLCKKEASGEIAVFTDDDAIALSSWIKRYVKLHKNYGNNVACISSRDLYLNLGTMTIVPTPDDLNYVKLYRWFIRPWLEKPHPLLKKYRFGVYMTKNLKIAHGPYIPGKPCYSLPFRGVNMSFKKEALDEVKFPEHPLLKRAPGNEQYVGLQLIIRGYECIYDPSNPILHMVRESLSRTTSEEIKMELRVMELFYLKLIKEYTKYSSRWYKRGEW